MRLSLFQSAAVTLLCAHTCIAQRVQAPPEAFTKATLGIKPTGNNSNPATKTRSAARESAVPLATAQSFSNYEYWTSVTIPAGGTINLDSEINYSSSDTVRLTFRSITTDIGNLVAAAGWSVPEIDHYNVQDLSFGSKFVLTSSGGAMFSVAGTQFRLVLLNTGTAAMKLDSVLLIARAE